MILEALIYDYAVHFFERNIERNADEHVKKYYDKLTLPAKWLIIPEVVNKKQISIDSRAFKLLEKLHKYRNEIVHTKTFKLPDTRQEFHEKCEKLHLMDIEEVHECPIQLVKELEKIDQTNYTLFKENVIWNFIHPSHSAKSGPLSSTKQKGKQR